MSFDIKYFNNEQGKKIYLTINYAFRPAKVDIYNVLNEIPKEVRYYAPKDSELCSEITAIRYAIENLLYPDLENCILKDYETEKCIKKACRYVDCKNHNK